MRRAKYNPNCLNLVLINRNKHILSSDSIDRHCDKIKLISDGSKEKLGKEVCIHLIMDVGSNGILLAKGLIRNRIRSVFYFYSVYDCISFMGLDYKNQVKFIYESCKSSDLFSMDPGEKLNFNFNEITFFQAMKLGALNQMRVFAFELDGYIYSYSYRKEKADSDHLLQKFVSVKRKDKIGIIYYSYEDELAYIK